MTLAVGAVFRHETRYLREWLEWHLLVGVDRFYLFNHDHCDAVPGQELSSDKVLAPYVSRGLVVNTPWATMDDYQQRANESMMALARADQADWMIAIDLDEFIIPVCAPTIAEALKPYELPRVLGVVVPLFNYGSAGLRHAPMLQTEAFIRRAKDDDVSNSYRKYAFRPGMATDFTQASVSGQLVDEDLKPDDAGRRTGRPCHALRINHYATRSVSDWEVRVRRGPPVGRRVSAADLADPQFYANRWILFDKNDVQDTLAWRFVPALKRRMGIE